MEVVTRGGSRVLSPKGDLTIFEAAEFREALLTFRHAGASPEVLHLFTQPFFLWPQRPDPMLWLFSRQRGHSPEQEISLPHTPPA